MLNRRTLQCPLSTLNQTMIQILATRLSRRTSLILPSMLNRRTSNHLMILGRDIQPSHRMMDTIRK
jgi:hypothetical protein